jgi:hypothetical protein
MQPVARGLASICVFCGSSDAADPALLAAAARFGAAVAQAGLRLVYGGGGVGLMGACAKAALAAGGAVLGVMPSFLTEHEVAYRGAEIVVVDTMHARKMRMFEEADAFAVLPGAIGTLEEAIELLSWRRLGLHTKPIAFFSPDGFWDPLLAQFTRFEDLRMVPREFADCWRTVERIEDLLPALLAMPTEPATPVPIILRA